MLLTRFERALSGQTGIQQITSSHIHSFSEDVLLVKNTAFLLLHFNVFMFVKSAVNRDLDQIRKI